MQLPGHWAEKKVSAGDPFSALDFFIARNALIDHIRKKETYRKHITTSEAAVESYAEPSSDDSSGSISI